MARANLFPQPTIKSPRFNALNFYVGVTYRFNKRNFNRVGATDEEVAAMLAFIAEKEEKIGEITAENNKLLRINAEQERQLNKATVKNVEVDGATVIGNHNFCN